MKGLHRHRRVDHLRLAAVAAPDAPLDVAAVGYELVHARRRGVVPEPQVAGHRRHQRALEAGRRPLARVLWIQFPQVAHGCVAVADVAGVGGNQNTLGRPRLAADHQIVSAQIELLERQRHQREQRAVVPPQGVEKRCLDAVAAQFAARAGWVVKQGEDVGFGKHPAECLKHSLAAPAIQQPVMDDCRAHMGRPGATL